MPRNFTPADRETVAEAAETRPHVHSVGDLGPGLIVQHKRDSDDYSRLYCELMAEYGWYVDMYNPFEDGHQVILMPVTEVPE